MTIMDCTWQEFAKASFSATIIAGSENRYTGTRITTFELEYPRFIHAELMTHRAFSRNAASSRAIPVTKVIEHVQNNTAMPVHWGKNQAGMQAKEEIQDVESAVKIWYSARDEAIKHAVKLHEAGCHKQIVNRLLEPFTIIKTLVTATDWNNWFWLRNHPDAQPEIKYLAEIMLQAMRDYEHRYDKLNDRDWHMPYVSWERTGPIQRFYDSEGNTLTESQAMKISASCCAQVSYRKLDTSTDKAENIFDRLIASEPVHASPTEHQAMCLNIKDYRSGNFRDFMQFRQTIANNVKPG
jgi:thymidylate synthase ThyX